MHIRWQNRLNDKKARENDYLGTMLIKETILLESESNNTQ